MGSAFPTTYHFFVFDGSASSPLPKPLPDFLAIRVFEPSWGRLRVTKFTSIWLYIFWFLFSRHRYKIYFVEDGERVVHLSHLISKNPKFPFLGRGDYEIGPCWTHADYRGMGIYPNVLKRIAEDMTGHSERLYIFAEIDNEASLKGIRKSGFRLVGTGRKSGLLGRYEIIQNSA
jgi:RimJ/RimL family protein N-acetyltransferase